jgi:hypothetical protein
MAGITENNGGGGEKGQNPIWVNRIKSYTTTQCYNLKNYNVYNHCCEKLETNNKIIVKNNN